MTAEGASLRAEKSSFTTWIGAFALVLAVRLYLFQHYYTINNDGVLYIDAARHFWEGKWVDGLASFYPPLFPLMIAAVYPLVGDWELAGQFWPLLLSLLIPLPLFGLLSRIHGSRVAQVAVVFYGVSPYLARLSLEVRTELPYSFFVILALFLFQRGLDDGRLRWFLWMGAGAALAYLIRPEGIGLVIVGALYLFYRGWGTGRLHRSWSKAGILALGFLLFAAPYVFYLRSDTGRWLISRKAARVLYLSLSQHDPGTEQEHQNELDQMSMASLISTRPLAYARKVFIDFFRSLGFYFEAIHYSYLPFLFLGWLSFFRARFWEKADFLLFVFIAFYIALFPLLYVTRRFSVPLVPVSLGWVGAGLLAMDAYTSKMCGKRGRLITGVVIVLFLSATLPKTLAAIGRDKFYLREAGVYLKGKPGNPTILTNNGRVAFYAEGKNRVVLKDSRDLSAFLLSADGSYLALDRESYKQAESSFRGQGWLFDREFSGGREGLSVLRRPAVP